MGVGGFIRKVFGKDKAGFEFTQNCALQETANEANRPSSIDEGVEQNRRIAYLTRDENAINFFLANKGLEEFSLYASPLNTTVKLDKKQEKLARIRLENAIIKKKLLMNARDYEANGFEIMGAIRDFGHFRISGAVEGWIGHLCTENVKQLKVTASQKG